MQVSLNGLPLGRMDHLTYPKDFQGQNYVLLPDLLLSKGKNVLSATWKASDKIDLQYYKGNEIRLVELESIEPQKLGRVLGTFRRSPDDVKAKKGREDEIAFEVEGDLPAWKWMDSPVIPDGPETEKKLIAAASALAKQWSGMVRGLGSAAEKDLADQEAAARRAGLAHDPQIAALKKMIASKKIGVEFRDDAARMQRLGGGRLARLAFVYGADQPDWNDIHVFPLSFRGGKHDAPRGQMGPVDIMVDVWFRLDGDRFVPVAVFGIWQDIDKF
jgi:hypothetical protein